MVKLFRDTKCPSIKQIWLRPATSKVCGETPGPNSLLLVSFCLFFIFRFSKPFHPQWSRVIYLRMRSQKKKKKEGKTWVENQVLNENFTYQIFAFLWLIGFLISFCDLTEHLFRRLEFLYFQLPSQKISTFFCTFIGWNFLSATLLTCLRIRA